MRFLIVLFLLAITFYSNSQEKVFDPSTDRPLEEKIMATVWVTIPGISGLSTLSHEDLGLLGGVFVPRPLESYDAMLLGTSPLPPLAVGLDTRLNPAPGFIRDLPDLEVLASIRDPRVIRRYLGFLQEAALGLGLDYLVLPEVDSSWKDAQALLLAMHQYDTEFFIFKSSLSELIITKKKELAAQLRSKNYLIMDADQIAGFKLLLVKYKSQKGLPSDSLLQLTQLRNDYKTLHQLRDHLPNKLAFEISSEAIIPLQKKSGIFPLVTDTLSLITENPASPLASMLSKYVYLLTTPEGITQSNSPILIDGEIDSIPISMINRKVIFSGLLVSAQKWENIADGMLLVPFQKQWNDYIIPQLLFGVGSASGKLPDHIHGLEIFFNDPLVSKGVLGYLPSELMGLDEVAIRKIHAIVEEAIQTRSTPGCQIGVAIGGNIVLEEGYGYLTYDSLISVDRTTLFDIASVSKVMGTLLAIMKLYEDGEIDLDAPLSDYMAEYRNSDKTNITIRQILAHQSGLKGYVPYWKRTLDPDQSSIFYMESITSPNSRTGRLQPSPHLQDSLRSWILNTSVHTTADSLHRYRYSDIGFMILHQLIERLTGTTLETYLIDNFYAKMGLRRLTYNPLKKGFDRFEIAPTEYDGSLRNELIWGEVHDQNAKVFGGVAGHAGLFSDTHDLLVVLQMILQKGQYNDEQFLRPETIDYFNYRYFENNRRGLGWDKPGLKLSNASKLASDESYGHTGFTGSLIWSDPIYDISFVFLSNRIYPDSRNMKLIQKDIRVKIQDVIYEAIITKWLN